MAETIYHNHIQVIDNQNNSCTDRPDSDNNKAMKENANHRFSEKAPKTISIHGKQLMADIDSMRDEIADGLRRQGFDEEAAFKKAEFLVPELKEIHLNTPPQYNEREDSNMGIIDFLRIYYRDEGWLDGRFTQKDLGKLNKSAAKALSSWFSREKDRMLCKDINLPKTPTLKELVKQGAIEELEAQEHLEPQEKIELNKLRSMRGQLEPAEI